MNPGDQQRIAQESFASIFAGVAATLTGHPLDIAKVLQQTGRKSVSSAVLSNPFRGLGPPIFSSASTTLVTFTLFNNLSYSPLVNGFIAGLGTAVITTPLDLLKIRQQLNKASLTSLVSSGSISSISSKLFNGFSVNCLREGVFTSVYLGIYKEIRPTQPTLLQIILASSSTGAVAWVASYPFDVIKTLQQSEGITITSAFNRVYSQHGTWRGFFRGCGVGTFRAILVTGSRLAVYEYIMANIQ